MRHFAFEAVIDDGERESISREMSNDQHELERRPWADSTLRRFAGVSEARGPSTRCLRDGVGSGSPQPKP
jgi:hypothetical protein